MISEATFAREFASFWRVATPMMDGFIRTLNRGAYHRDFPPMLAATAPNRRSFINELAFNALCIAVKTIQATGQPASIDDAFARAAEQVRFDAIRGGWSGDHSTEPLPDEIEDAMEQIRRTRDRVHAVDNIQDVVCQPTFPGCGIVDRCQGDILVDKTLFEIKAGDRLFRSIDFRQLLAYLALNHVEHSYSIGRIGLVNPRVGISLEMDVDEFCFEVSGRDARQLFDLVIYTISSGDISR